MASTPHFQIRPFRPVRLALCAALLFAAASPALRAGAPRQDAPPQKPPSLHLVSAKEGRKIAAAALRQEEPVRGTQDCSHLVHEIYSLAGYDYPYASSFDLYAGHGNFRRVRHVQPGDLIAWPGHVGIVLDPAHHSFYSLVRSGLQAENYQSPYWRSRGTPRFYRYNLDAAPELRAAKASPPILAETSARSKVLPPPATTESEEPDSAASTVSSIVLTSERRAPTEAEALDGISELSKTTAVLLRAAEPLNGKLPVVIVDEFQIERIETKHDKGWAHLQIDSHVRIAADGTDFKRRREKLRWELRRDASGWTVIAPADRAYVAKDAAVRALAARLAEMTQSEAAAQHQENVIGQEARIANLLSALLQD